MRPILSAPCGPVQGVRWSPISFGSSDVRRRTCRPDTAARVPPTLTALSPTKDKALPISTTNLL